MLTMLAEVTFAWEKREKGAKARKKETSMQAKNKGRTNSK
jgi:hypothetical protein